uniref:DEAD/DEAH-box helicase domain-containing protein n=1 Tax=Magallana gigas TaxID=29159 RepID=A0A8W8KTZ8_MAGGI
MHFSAGNCLLTQLFYASSIQCDFDEVLEFAKEFVNINFELKDKQIQTLKSLYEGHDTMAVLPTGFGKSIIFQLLPFLFQRKLGQQQPMISLIVTPLNSIMQDQVRSLTKLGINACYLNIEGTGVKTFDAVKRSLPAISSPLIRHASGLAASRRHQGVLYTHNDRSSPHPHVFALNASTSGLTKFLQMPLN